MKKLLDEKGRNICDSWLIMVSEYLIKSGIELYWVYTRDLCDSKSIWKGLKGLKGKGEIKV
jgi:hypothetical protein